jgi:trehalose/maltose transport system permease protein
MADRSPPDPGSVERHVAMARVLAAALIALGLTAIGALAAAIAADAGVRSALAPAVDGVRPSLVLAVLDGFGLIVPILAIGLGLVAIVFGVRVAARDAATLRMARDAATWIVLIAAVVLVARLLQGAGPVGVADATLARWAGGWIAPAVALALAFVLRLALTRAADAPDLPPEPLIAREARSAWNLLLPALLILVVVAARPLEATIITSVTDKRFASSEVPNFVGLQHYRELLTVSFDPLTCRTDDGGVCQRSADGSIRWDALPRERLLEGYRTAFVLDLPLITGPDTALSLSALDRDWIRSIWTTLVFTVLSVSGELILGLFLALTVHSSFRGRGAMRAVMLVPWAIPTVVSARLWELMLKDTGAGVLNRFLLDVGLLDQPLAWLTTSSLQLPSAIMIDVWKTAPFMGLLLLAGLQTIPKELYESARVDGATRVREFFAITLPLLRPAIGVALIFRTLDALRVFDLFQVLFGRSERSISTYNFEVLIANQEAGYASAVGVLIFLLIFVFAVAYVRVLGVNRS